MAWPCPSPWSFFSQATIFIALTPGFSKPFFSASFLKSSVTAGQISEPFGCH
jgi:hypothetical protein